MKSILQFVRDERHMLILMPILYIPVTIICGYWQIAIIFAGVELNSQSWHENRHKDQHQRVWVNHWGWRVTGAFIAFAGAWLLRK